MTQPASNIANLTNIITAPKLTFAAVKEKPTVLFPFLLILAVGICMLGYFFATVDFAWMIDHMVDVQTVGKSNEEREAMQKAMGVMSLKVMAIGGMVGMLVTISLVFTIFAAYLMLVNKLLDSENFSYKSWFALVCWASVPSIFTSLASIINVLLATDGQITLEAINPLTFNNLFFHLAPSDRLFGPINSWDPITIWTQILMIIGFSQWTGKSVGKSAAIVLAPTIIIYGIWIALALK